MKGGTDMSETREPGNEPQKPPIFFINFLYFGVFGIISTFIIFYYFVGGFIMDFIMKITKETHKIHNKIHHS